MQLAMAGTIEEAMLQSLDETRQRQKGRERADRRRAGKRAREREQEEVDDGRQAAMLNGLKLLRVDY